MRLPAWFAALTVVALAAWLLLDGGPRRGGDGVSRAVAARPDAREAPHETLRDVTGDPLVPASEPASPERVEAAEAQPKRAREPTVAPLAPEDRPSGTVAGLLRSESGTWHDLGGLLRGSLLVELRDPGDPRAVRGAQLEPVGEPDGSIAIAFRFEDVPAGDYRLDVTSLADEVWAPARLALRAPGDGFVVWCRDRLERVRLAFDVRDAESGAPIEHWTASALRQTADATGGVLLQAGPVDLEGFPADGRLDWSLVAPGYAPAFGDERAFEPDPAGARLARVALCRGWAARVVVLARDPDMRPIAGARVELDGAFAGVTGARGWLDVARPTTPAALAVRWGALGRNMEPVRAADSDEAVRRGQMLVVVLQ